MCKHHDPDNIHSNDRATLAAPFGLMSATKSTVEFILVHLDPTRALLAVQIVRASVRWPTVAHVNLMVYADACIEDPVVIQKILDHLKPKAEPKESTPLPESPAPPMRLFA